MLLDITRTRFYVATRFLWKGLIITIFKKAPNQEFSTRIPWIRKPGGAPRHPGLGYNSHQKHKMIENIDLFKVEIEEYKEKIKKLKERRKMAETDAMKMSIDGLLIAYLEDQVQSLHFLTDQRGKLCRMECLLCNTSNYLIVSLYLLWPFIVLLYPWPSFGSNVVDSNPDWSYCVDWSFPINSVDTLATPKGMVDIPHGMSYIVTETHCNTRRHVSSLHPILHPAILLCYCHCLLHRREDSTPVL